MNKITISIFTIYIVLGLYFLSIAIQTPFVNITLTENNGQLIVEEPYYPKWAQQHNIEKGDILLRIDQQNPFSNPAVQKKLSVFEAKELSLLKADGTIHTVSITHFDLPEQLFTLIIFPMLYFVLSICVTIYLGVKTRIIF